MGSKDILAPVVEGMNLVGALPVLGAASCNMDDLQNYVRAGYMQDAQSCAQARCQGQVGDQGFCCGMTCGTNAMKIHVPSCASLIDERLAPQMRLHHCSGYLDAFVENLAASPSDVLAPVVEGINLASSAGLAASDAQTNDWIGTLSLASIAGAAGGMLAFVVFSRRL